MIHDKQYDAVCVPTNLGASLKQLTAYQLSLGDVQYAGNPESGNKCVTRLWREHGIYHIRTHSFALHVRVVWETARTLGEARKLFKAQVAAYVAV